jgi:tetratricopeptide (TPR) repeat protein/nitrate/TMAO reductase-like tetraheme cytochrome c subunit
MAPADAGSVLGRFDGSTLAAHGVVSTFFTKEGRPWIRTDGPDGSLRDFPVAYAFGADPLQQYLVEFPGGRYQVPGTCWDSRPAEQGGQRWYHLYPDSEAIRAGDVLHWTGPMQNWNFMCAECHSTDLRKNYDAGRDRFDTRWSEVNVSCEACHGPGSRHASWARRRAAGKEDDDETLGLEVRLKEGVAAKWIFDPGQAIARPESRRPTRAEVETCARCHARRAQVWPEHRAGRPLADTHLVSLLEENLYHADGQIQDEVYEYGSFVQSKMHRAAVTCSNCHEPHAGRLRLPGNALCGQCHQPAKYDAPSHHRHKEGSPGARCVECHMPARTYMGVDRRRDHGFRVPRPDLTVKLGTPNACAGCHADRPAAWAAEAVSAWTGGKPPAPHFAEAIAAGRAGRADAERRLSEAAANPEFPPIARGTALSLLAGYLGPTSLGLAQRAARDEEILVRQGAVAALAAAEPGARAQALAPLLRDPVRTIRTQAAAALLDVPSLPEEARGAFEAALAEWVEMQRFNLDRAESHLNLGNLAIQRGRLEEAEAAYARAVRMQPASAAGHVNLAEARSRRGRLAEAEAGLREGLPGAAEEAPLRHALGLILVRQGRRREALEELRRAAEAAPGVARYAYVHAIGVDSLGDREGAMRLLEAAHDRFPADREILSALVSLPLERGDAARALPWARKLRERSPDDPQVRAWAEEVERRAAERRP